MSTAIRFRRTIDDLDRTRVDDPARHLTARPHLCLYIEAPATFPLMCNEVNFELSMNA